MRTTSFEAITWWPIEISVKFQKRLIGNQGSPIGWSRDHWSRVVTWPTFWKLGQSTAQKCDVSRSPMEISEKFQKRLIANQGSPIGWSRDQWFRVVTWPTFWKLGQGTAQKCDISRSLMAVYGKKSYFSPISMLGNSRVIFHVVTAITLLSVIQNIKQQIIMQKLLRSSNMSCSNSPSSHF